MAVFSAFSTAAATAIPHVSAYNTVRQRVVLPLGWAGHRFRLQARLRADTVGSGGAMIKLGLMAFDRHRRFRFGETLPPAQEVKAPQWQAVQVTGKLPHQTDFVFVTLIFGLNGTFGVDDVRLEIETARNHWEPLPLQNADFADSTPADSASGLPVGWALGAVVPGFSYQGVVDALVTGATSPDTGNPYLEIRGRGLVNYGHHRAAGHHQPLTGGISIYYETYGAPTAPPLLLLHGNGETIGSFREQIGALAAHYRVIAVDTRGHGQSTTNRQRYTYDLFADDMAALLDSLDISEAHIVGWSDGGNTGLSMALRHPAHVASLTTMGANLYPDRGAVDKKTIGEVRLIRAVSTVLYPFAPKWRRAHRLATLLLRYPRMMPGALAAIRAPTLVLAGEKDVITEPHTRLIAAGIPGAECVILPGLTHYAPQEDGPRFNQTVLDFLARHPVAGR